MGDYLEKFYKRNLSLDEIVRRVSSTQDLALQDPVPEEPDNENKYQIIKINHISTAQIIFLFIYLELSIYFWADTLGLAY